MAEDSGTGGGAPSDGPRQYEPPEEGQPRLVGKNVAPSVGLKVAMKSPPYKNMGSGKITAVYDEGYVSVEWESGKSDFCCFTGQNDGYQLILAQDVSLLPPDDDGILPSDSNLDKKRKQLMGWLNKKVVVKRKILALMVLTSIALWSGWNIDRSLRSMKDCCAQCNVTQAGLDKAVNLNKAQASEIAELKKKLVLANTQMSDEVKRLNKLLVDEKDRASALQEDLAKAASEGVLSESQGLRVSEAEAAKKKSEKDLVNLKAEKKKQDLELANLLSAKEKAENAGEELRAQLKESKQKIEELKAQGLKDADLAAAAEKELQRKVDSLNKEIEDQKTRKGGYDSELQRAQNDLDLESKARAAEARDAANEIRGLVDESGRLNLENAKFLQSLESSDKSLMNLESELQASRDEGKGLRDQLDAAQQMLDQSQREQNSQRKEISNLNSKVEKAEGAEKLANATLGSLRKDIEDLTIQLKEMSKKKKSAEQNLEKETDGRVKEEAERLGLEEKLKGLTLAVEDAQREKDSTLKELSSLDAENKKLQSSKDTEMQAKVKAIQKAKELTDQLKTNEGDLKKLKAALDKAEKELKQSQIAFTSSDAKLTKEIANHQETALKVQELKDKLREAEANLDKAIERVPELERKEIELQELKQSTAEAAGHIKELEGTISGQKEANAEMLSANHELQVEISTLNSSTAEALSSLNAELAASTKAERRLKKEVEGLRGQVAQGLANSTSFLGRLEGCFLSSNKTADRVQGLTKDKTGAEKEAKTCASVLKDQEEEARKQEAKVLSTEKANTRLNDEVAELQKKIGDLTRYIGEIQANTSKILENEKEKTGIQKAKVKSALKEKELAAEELIDLKAQLHQCDHALNESKNSCQRQVNESVAHAIADKKAKIKGLKIKARDLGEENQKLKAELEASKEALKEYISNSKTCLNPQDLAEFAETDKAENQRLAAELKSLQDQLGDCQKALGAGLAEAEKLNHRADQCEEKEKKLAKDLQSCQKSDAENKRRVKDLNAEKLANAKAYEASTKALQASLAALDPAAACSKVQAYASSIFWGLLLIAAAFFVQSVLNPLLEAYRAACYKLKVTRDAKTIEDMHNEIDLLQREVARLTREKNILIDKNKSLQAECSELSKKLEFETNARKKAQATVLAEKERAAVMEMHARKLKEGLMDTTDCIGRSGSELKDVNKNLEKEASYWSQMQQEYLKAREELSKLKQEYQKTKKELEEALKNLHAEKELRVQETEKRIQAEKQLKQALSENEDLKKEIERLKKELKDALDLVEFKDKKLVEAHEEIMDLRRRLDEANQKIDVLGKKIKELETEVARERDMREAAQREAERAKAELSKALTDLKKAQEALEEEVRKREEAEASLEKALRDLEQAKTALEEEKKARLVAEDARAKAEKIAKDLALEIEQKNLRISELEDEIKKLKRQLSAAMQETEEVRIELRELKHDYEDLETEYAKVKAQLEKALADKLRAEEERDRAVEEHRPCAGRIAELLQQIDELQHQLAREQARVKSLEAAVKAAEDEIAARNRKSMEAPKIEAVPIKLAAPPSPPPKSDKLCGLGILLHQDIYGKGKNAVERTYVEDIVVGGAAYNSHQVRKNDILISIDSVDVHGMTLDDIKNMTLGLEGTVIFLEIERPEDHETFTVELTRAHVSDHHVEHHKENDGASRPRANASQVGRTRNSPVDEKKESRMFLY